LRWSTNGQTGRRKGEMGTVEDELCGVIQRSEAGGPLVVAVTGVGDQ
jgi:Fe2+ transport system protein FeoA